MCTEAVPFQNQGRGSGEKRTGNREQSARKDALDAPVVGAPAFDALLDLLAVEILFKRQLGEFDDLVIGGKSEANELILAEPADLGVPRLGSQRLQAELLLEADDAVLDLQWIEAQFEEREEGGDGDKNQPPGIEGRVVHRIDGGDDDIADENKRQEKVIGGIESCMIFEVLFLLVTHARRSSP
jgi:hypothetical protein